MRRTISAGIIIISIIGVLYNRTSEITIEIPDIGTVKQCIEIGNIRTCF